MNGLEWAKREIEIAKKRERGDKPEEEWDYGCACYDSALKALESLSEDGHSGFSMCFTKQILNRLIDRKPLTPIEDVEEVWENRGSENREGYTSYQCNRMSSLFKDVSDDGAVIYHDVNRFTMCDVNGVYWHNGLISNLGHEMYPITMPYAPYNDPFVFYADDCLTDPKNGDYDTRAIFYLITPEGERVDIQRYFREPYEGEEPTYHGWVEIDAEEYADRVKLAEERAAKDQEEEKSPCQHGGAYESNN